MHKFLSCNCADKCGAWSLSFLRVVTGLTFAIHGYQKISMGVDNFANMLLLLGVPAAPFMAWVVTLVELIGGILIILGITHWASKLLIIDMLVAIWLVHLPNGFNVGQGGYEFNLLLIAALFTLISMGPGTCSIGKKHQGPARYGANPSAM